MICADDSSGSSNEVICKGIMRLDDHIVPYPSHLRKEKEPLSSHSGDQMLHVLLRSHLRLVSSTQNLPGGSLDLARYASWRLWIEPAKSGTLAQTGY
jgi:hypothetical protein